MISKEYCQAMAQYNSKMNNRLYGVCDLLPEENRIKDVGLFFDSIHKTLEHLLYADMTWLLRFIGRESDAPDMDEVMYSNFKELKQYRREWDEEIFKWSTSVNEEWLGTNFSFTSKVDGQTRTRAACLLVVHMFNHGTHHRGQLTTALNQLGLDFGVTDLPFLIKK